MKEKKTPKLATNLLNLTTLHFESWFVAISLGFSYRLIDSLTSLYSFDIVSLADSPKL